MDTFCIWEFIWTRSLGRSVSFLLTPAEGWGALQAPYCTPTHSTSENSWNLQKTVKYFLMSIFTTRVGADPKVMDTIESGLSRCFFWYLAKSDRTYSSWDNSWNLQKSQIICLMSSFTTRGGANPKVMGTVESGSSRCFFWHLAKSDQPYSSWDNGWNLQKTVK